MEVVVAAPRRRPPDDELLEREQWGGTGAPIAVRRRRGTEKTSSFVRLRRRRPPRQAFEALGDSTTVALLPANGQALPKERRRPRVLPPGPRHPTKQIERRASGPRVARPACERHALLQQRGGPGLIALLMRRPPQEQQRQGGGAVAPNLSPECQTLLEQDAEVSISPRASASTPDC